MNSILAFSFLVLGYEWLCGKYNDGAWYVGDSKVVGQPEKCYLLSVLGKTVSAATGL